MRESLLVAVVGPCGAGKSTLVAGLRAHGVQAREVAQEHSHVPGMWRRTARPDVLIYLQVSRQTAERRLGRALSEVCWQEISDRLAQARACADWVVDTDSLSPEEVLQQVLDFLSGLTVPA